MWKLVGLIAWIAGLVALCGGFGAIVGRGLAARTTLKGAALLGAVAVISLVVGAVVFWVIDVTIIDAIVAQERATGQRSMAAGIYTMVYGGAFVVVGPGMATAGCFAWQRWRRRQRDDT